MRNRAYIRIALFLLLAAVTSSCSHSVTPATNLKPLAADTNEAQVIDLTHSFDPAIPHWKGLPKMEIKTLYNYDKDGFIIYQYQIAGQWGTHVDAPVHFHKNALTLTDIPVTDMVLPLVVIDTHEIVANNPDYQLQMKDIEKWEQLHGQIPAHSLVAMRTDWSSRWPDEKKMQNKDSKGIAHYPGWSKETLQFLIEQRHVAAFAHETSDTDPGIATSKDDYSLESYILSQGLYQIEFIDNLNSVPEAGATVVVAWPKVKNGAGFPARVIAMVPRCNK